MPSDAAILKRTAGVLRSLGDQARIHENRILPIIWNVTKRLETGRFAFPYVSNIFLSNSIKNKRKVFVGLSSKHLANFLRPTPSKRKLKIQI